MNNKKQDNIAIPSDLKKEMKIFCAERNLTIKEFAVRAITKLMRQEKDNET